MSRPPPPSARGEQERAALHLVAGQTCPLAVQLVTPVMWVWHQQRLKEWLLSSEVNEEPLLDELPQLGMKASRQRQEVQLQPQR